jgi:hypothetical protein
MMAKQLEEIGLDVMIKAIVNDMKNWLDSDPDAFWHHVKRMETERLKKLESDEVCSLYRDVTDNGEFQKLKKS